MKAGCSCITHPSATKYVQKQASKHTPFDLNVLSTPPAFILSQDRTLEIIVSKPFSRSPSSLGSPRALRLTLFGSNLKSELLYSALFIFLIELYFLSLPQSSTAVSSRSSASASLSLRFGSHAPQPQLSELTSWYFLVLVVQFSLSALPSLGQLSYSTTSTFNCQGVFSTFFEFLSRNRKALDFT